MESTNPTMFDDNADQMLEYKENFFSDGHQISDIVMEKLSLIFLRIDVRYFQICFSSEFQ